MSGHSKWSKIKRKKGREDIKRGKIFSKIIKELTVAARLGGGDESSNPRLRLAVEKAKEANMPQTNIERAIKKGTGELAGVHYEEGICEGYGPEGVAVMVGILTDNKKRTISDIRHIFTKTGGNLGEAGCVSWIFTKMGIFSFEREQVDVDKLYEVALDEGVEDIKEEGSEINVYTTPSDYERIKEVFDKSSFKYSYSDINMIPKNTVNLSGSTAEAFLRFMEDLEDHDDIQHVYANFDIPTEVMEKLA